MMYSLVVLSALTVMVTSIPVNYHVKPEVNQQRSAESWYYENQLTGAKLSSEERRAQKELLQMPYNDFHGSGAHDNHIDNEISPLEVGENNVDTLKDDLLTLRRMISLFKALPKVLQKEVLLQALQEERKPAPVKRGSLFGGNGKRALSINLSTESLRSLLMSASARGQMQLVRSRDMLHTLGR